ncbi:MAG TPA: PIN domain-containing protein [Jiangellaceae bacterium]
MTTILDSHGVTVLADDRARIAEMLDRGEWPPLVPAAVLVECLTGDNRRDFRTNRLLRQCNVREVSEVIARHAARLRTLARGDRISPTDAIVAATADHAGGGVILTSDVDDLRALAENSEHTIRIAHV